MPMQQCVPTGGRFFLCSFNRSNVHEYDDMAIFVARHLTPSSNQPVCGVVCVLYGPILPKINIGEQRNVLRLLLSK